MLEYTFVHIQGIGPKTERRIWKRGITTWNAFMESGETIFSPSRDIRIREELLDTVKHRSDASYFSTRLASSEMWRLFGDFSDSTVYLDIETSGGYDGENEITVIGLYDGSGSESFINGRNLEDFEAAVAEYDLVVTFNGTCFDIPVIKRYFRGITLPPAHIDLRFMLKKLGFSGGLKNIEKEFCIGRDSSVEGMNGYDAVLMWRDYQRGDSDALSRLVEYNRADIVNLKPLMEMGFERMKREYLRGISLT